MTLQFIQALNAALFVATGFDRLKRPGLELVGRQIGADGCVLIVSEAGNLQSRLVYHYGDTASEVESDLPRTFFARDPIIRQLTEQLERGPLGVAGTRDIPDAEAFRGSDVYREVYLRHGMRQNLSGAVAPMAGAIGIVSFYRARDTPFGAEDAALLRAVLPAIGGALRRIMIEHGIMGCLAPRSAGSDLTLRIPDAQRSLPGLMRDFSGDVATPLPDPEATAALRIETSINRLSDRERQIAHLVTHGLTNSQIARETRLSYRTVEFHVSSILRKLDVTNRTGLCHLINSLNAARAPFRTDPPPDGIARPGT